VRGRPVPVDAAAPAKGSFKSPEPAPDLKVLPANPGRGKNDAAMDSLEDEMAKMLGRPGKS
jgi:hypothetical protein